MNTPLLIVSSTIVLSFLVSAGVILNSSFAQQNQTNMTTATNQTNQTGEGNQTQQGPLEQLGEAITGMFGGGNQSQ
jgi:hypothetical protein